MSNTLPTRIQRKRTKGWRMPENTIYVGRPTKWGNPYKIGDINLLDTTPEEAASIAFKYGFTSAPPDYQEEMLAPLRGKNLACWCPLDQPCHADVLLELANKEPS